MTKKLTLTIESEFVETTKKYAAFNGRSLSELVENYLKSLTVNKENKPEDYSPKVNKLKGIISLEPDFDYKKLVAKEFSKKYNNL